MGVSPEVHQGTKGRHALQKADRGEGRGVQGDWLDGRLAPPVDGTTFVGASAGELTVAAGAGRGVDVEGTRTGVARGGTATEQ